MQWTAEIFETTKMVGLNVASVGVVLLDSMYTNAPQWSITFLIVSVAILNLAKGYRLFADAKRKKEEEQNKPDNEKA